MLDLTLVTPCLDPGARLDRALASVLAQRGPRFEHIVADGGSTDATLERLDRHRAACDHAGIAFSLIPGPDRGQSHAINRAMAIARGRCAGWLNADDELEPGALARVVAALDATGADVLVGRCLFIDESGRVVWEPRAPDPVTPESLLRVLSMWFAGRSIAQPEAFFRISAWRALASGGGEGGVLDESNHHTMDHDLWVRLALAGARFAHLDAPLARLHVHAGQKTRDKQAVARSVLRSSLALVPRLRPSPERDLVHAELARLARKVEVLDALDVFWRTPPVVGPGSARPRGAEDEARVARVRAELGESLVLWSGDALPLDERLREAEARGSSIVIADEPASPDEIAPAISWTRARLADRLTFNDDVLLDPRTDAAIEVASRRPIPRWPHDFRASLIARGYREAARERAPTPEHHPLLPWAWTGPAGIGGGAVASAWVRPRRA